MTDWGVVDLEDDPKGGKDWGVVDIDAPAGSGNPIVDWATNTASPALGSLWEGTKRLTGAAGAAANYAMTRPAEWMGVGGGKSFGELAGAAMVPQGNQEITPLDAVAGGPAAMGLLNRYAPQAGAYTGAVARPAVEMATSMAIDPITYAAFGKLPAALQKTATAIFTGQMGQGAMEDFKKLLDEAGKLNASGKSISPEYVEKAVRMVLSAGGTAAGAKHLAEPIQTPHQTPENGSQSTQMAPPPDSAGGEKSTPLAGSGEIPSGPPAELQVQPPEYQQDTVNNVRSLFKQEARKGNLPEVRNGVGVLYLDDGSRALMYMDKEGNPKAAALVGSDGTVTDIAGLEKNSLAAGRVLKRIQGLNGIKLPETDKMSPDSYGAVEKHALQPPPKPVVQTLPHEVVDPQASRAREDFENQSLGIPDRGPLEMNGPPKALEGGGQPLSPPPSDLNGTKGPEGERDLYLAGGDRAAVKVSEVLGTYLKDVKLEAPFTSKHQQIRSQLTKVIGEKGWEKVSQETGVPIVNLHDFMTAGSGAGRELNRLRLEGKSDIEALEKIAEKDPEARKALESLKEATSKNAPMWDFLMKAGRMAWYGERSLKKFYQASLAGTIQVTGANFLNGAGSVTLDRIHDWAIDGYAKAAGVPELSARYHSREYLRSAGNAFVELAGSFGIGKGNRDVAALKNLLETWTSEKAQKLYHYNATEIDSPKDISDFRNEDAVDKATHVMLAPNLIQDAVLRMTKMQVELFHLTKEPGVQKFIEQGMSPFEAMGEFARVNKPFREKFIHEVTFASTEALRVTGGLQSPEGSITRAAVDLWARLPFPAWVINPFLNFTLSNALPTVMEHIPLASVVSSKTRAGRSIRYEGLLEREQGVKEKLKELKAKEGLSPSEANTLVLLRKELKGGLNAEGKHEPGLEQTIDKWEKDGLYRPEKVYARQATGALLIALFASLRYSLGDNGTNYNQVLSDDRDGKKKVIDTSSVLGTHAPYALLGDVLGHMALGTEKYGTRPGQYDWEAMLESLGTKTGSPLLDIVTKGYASEDSLKKNLTRAASQFARGMTSGAWIGEIARRGAAVGRPEADVSRRSDLNALDGVKMNIPIWRDTLPAATDKTTGLPMERESYGKSVHGPEDILPGQRIHINEIAQFLQDNKGWVRGSEVLAKNTSDPAFDALVGKYSKEGFDNTMVPWLREDAPSIKDRNTRVESFTSTMQSIREKAIDAAIMDYVMDEKSLPREILEPMKREAERKNILKMEPPPPVQRMGAKRASPNSILRMQGIEPSELGISEPPAPKGVVYPRP